MKSINEIKSRMKKLGYAFFDTGDYNLNIIGIRNKTLNTNTFNDEMYVIYRIGNQWVENAFPITTEPGFKSLTELQNKKGAAILVPGQYRGCWTIGKHRGQYEALVQCKSVKVYRDANKDKKVDMNPKTIDEGVFGINMHKAGADSKIVDNWSAGCQVFKRACDFQSFMSIVKKSAKLYGNKFSYTLLDDWE